LTEHFKKREYEEKERENNRSTNVYHDSGEARDGRIAQTPRHALGQIRSMPSFIVKLRWRPQMA